MPHRVSRRICGMLAAMLLFSLLLPALVSGAVQVTPAGPNSVAVSDSVYGEVTRTVTSYGTLPMGPGRTIIAGGAGHTAAVDGTGTVWIWGDNSKGQLGNGTYTNSLSPVMVQGLTDVMDLAVGEDFNIALRSGGTVWAWGDNIFDQLGPDASPLDQTTPVQVPNLTGIVAVAAGGSHSLALDGNGDVWAWGWNDYNQLGDRTLADEGTPDKVLGLPEITAIAAGENHSIALDISGNVWAWGNNASGQLGNANGGTSATPLQINTLTNVTAIAASTGSRHNLALKADGTVWAWGSNLYKQLGNSTALGTEAVPVQVEGENGVGVLGNMTAIAAGAEHSLARDAAGNVWAWGWNDGGQLGNGGVTGNYSVPSKVLGESGQGVLGGIEAIGTGELHSMALAADGTLRVWGNNDAPSPLGIGVAGGKYGTPVPVRGLVSDTVVDSPADEIFFTTSRDAAAANALYVNPEMPDGNRVAVALADAVHGDTVSEAEYTWRPATTVTASVYVPHDMLDTVEFQLVEPDAVATPFVYDAGANEWSYHSASGILSFTKDVKKTGSFSLTAKVGNATYPAVTESTITADGYAGKTTIEGGNINTYYLLDLELPTPTGGGSEYPPPSDSYCDDPLVAPCAELSVDGQNGRPTDVVPFVEEAAGLLQVQLKNVTPTVVQVVYEGQTVDSYDYTELPGLETYRIDVQTGDYEPVMLIGTGGVFSWNRGGTAGNYTASITVQPISFSFDRDGAVDENGHDKAEISYDHAVQLAIDNGSMLTAEEKELLRGMYILTNAQEFGRPEYNAETKAISVYVKGPHFNAVGNENIGVFVAFLPDALLNSWGVTSVEQLSAALSDGSGIRDRQVAAVEGGMVFAFKIGYSAKTVTISAEATNVQPGEPGGNPPGENPVTKEFIYGDFRFPQGVSYDGFRIRVYEGARVPSDLEGAIADKTYEGASSGMAVSLYPRTADGWNYMHTSLAVEPGVYSILITKPGYQNKVENVTVALSEEGFTSYLPDTTTYNVDGFVVPYQALQRIAGGGNTGGGGNNNGGTPPAANPSDSNGDEGMTEGDRGVVLGKDAAAITEETTPDGRQLLRIAFDAEQLSSAFKSLQDRSEGERRVTFNLGASGDTTQAEIPANALAAAAEGTSDAILEFASDAGSYELPVSLLNLAGLAQQLGTDVDGMVVVVKMEKVAGAAAEGLQAAAAASGFTLLGEPMEFSITVQGNGNSQDISDFGNTYVTRSIVLLAPVDGGQATAVLFDPETGEMQFVPALFMTENGQTRVIMKRNGNSIYTVVESNKSFADLVGHWAKRDVELLASKLILNGTSETMFSPDQKITRAEFAAMLVRSLGLAGMKEAADFSDVSAEAWYAGAVGAAVHAGIVNGFADGEFKPNDQITREQMAVMIARAIKFAGKSAEIPGAASLSSKVSDGAAISGWAQAAVLQAIEASVIAGRPDGSFAPAADATRAEAAAMLKRMLVYVEFMN